VFSVTDGRNNAGEFDNRVAEKILCAIYGEDLIGCRITPEVIAPIIQEALDANAKKEQTVNSLFVQVLEKIQLIATLPDRSQVRDYAHLASLLGERADAIQVITSETLKAWHKLNAPQGGGEQL